MYTMIRLMALAALLALSACATSPTTTESTTGDGGDTTAAEDGTGGAEDGAGDGEGEGAQTVSAEECPPNCDFRRDALTDSSSLLADRTIYFEFDSSKVQERFMDVIQRHAAYLSQYSDVEVRLEGHTDERGSREYNIGLGERRAQSVARLLQAYGTGSDQIETVSYGEEVPAVEGHNEEAWAKNRRVELVYPARGGSN